MSLIVNLVPVSRGGGLQNAMSFLKTVVAAAIQDELTVFVREGSELEAYCHQNSVCARSIQVRGGLRFYREFFAAKKGHRGEVCFTLFGPPLFGSAGRLVNVVGCAYSNLLYPELEFWSNLKGWSRTRAELVDVYRRKMLSKADFWVFETAALAERAVRLVGLPENRVATIRMAPSKLVSREAIDSAARERLEKVLPQGFLFLHLCGAQPNKRVDRMAGIIAEMRRQGVQSCHVITTIPEGSAYLNTVQEAFSSEGVSDALFNLGPVPPNEVVSLLSCVDALCTFSRLESFSNNFVEAWAMGMPLVVTDADWSRSSCGNAAVYVDPEDPKQAASSLEELVGSSERCGEFAKESARQLATYPSPEEKLGLQMAVIEVARNLGPCPEAVRRQFRWPRYRSTT